MESGDAVTRAPSIDFELRFAGAAASDASRQSRECGVHLGETREHVAQLRELDLKLAFPALRASGEDVENELSAVENLQVGRRRDRAHLGRREASVEDDEVRSFLKRLG